LEIQAGIKGIFKENRHAGIFFRSLEERARLIILEALAERTDLKSLELNAYYSFPEHKNECMEKILSILKGNKDLRIIYSLNLCGNNLDANDLEKLGGELENKYIDELALSENLIGDKGAEILSGKLERIMVRALFMNAMGIGDKGMEHLAKAWSTSIKYVELGSNNITTNGVSNLIGILRDSAKYLEIKEIDLHENNILENELNYRGIKNKNGEEIEFKF
jgi:hypothetical protein